LGRKPKPFFSTTWLTIRKQIVFAHATRKQNGERPNMSTRKTPLSCGNVPGSHRVRRRRLKPPGESYNSRSYHQAVRNACIKAFPVPDENADDPQAIAKWHADHRWFPNQLRHAAATAIRKQFGLEAAQVLLGHSKADVTQIYAERDLAKAANVARQIG
jgi:hypothetical protein